MSPLAIRALKRAGKSVLTHPVSTAAAIASLSLCMLLLGLLSSAYISFKRAIPVELQESSILVYLHPQVSERDQDSIVKEARQWPEVEEVSIVSRDEARILMEGQLGPWKGILDGFSENPLPASLKIRLKSRAKLSEATESVGEKLGKYPQVEEVLYGKVWAEKLESALNYVEFVGLTLTGLLALTVVLIISGSIKLAILSCSDELEVGRIVGAGSAFLRHPFYIEGMIQGGVSGALAFAVIAIWVASFGGSIPIPLAGLLSPEPRMAYSLAAGLPCSGVALGWLGSYLALRGQLSD